MLRSQNLKVSKLVFKEILNAIKYYYGIIAIISIFFTAIFYYTAKNGSIEGSVNGFGFSALIFLFFTGMGFFKSSFGFTQANNVSRRSFYSGAIIGVVAASGAMAVFEVILNNVLRLFMPYESLMEMIYIRKDIFADLLWSFTCFCLFLSIGWLMGMILYRLEGKIKTLLIVIPILTVAVVGVIDEIFSLNIYNNIYLLLIRLLSLVDLNPYVAAMNLTLASAIVLGFCFPIIKRMPLRG